MSPKSLSQKPLLGDILKGVSSEDHTSKKEETPPTEGHEEREAHSSEASDSTHEAPAADEVLDLDDIPREFSAKPKLKDLLHSPDSPSRYFTFLSLIFAGLAVICFGFLIQQYLKYRHNAQKEAEAKIEEAKLYGGWLNGQYYFKKKGPDGMDPLITQALGEFRVSWKGAELRVDLVAECTDEETCKSLKDQELQIRDLLLPVLQGSSQAEILNPNQKLALRRKLADTLNELKLKGQVIQIDFSDMTIEANSEPKKL